MNGLWAATLDRAPPWESLHLYRSLSATTYSLQARGGQNNVRDNKWVKAQHNGVTEVCLWCHTWVRKINPEGITETGRVSVTFLAYSVFSYQHAPVQFSTSIPPAFPYFCYLVDSFPVGTGLRREHLLRLTLVSAPDRVRRVSGKVANPPHEGTAAKLNCTVVIRHHCCT